MSRVILIFSIVFIFQTTSLANKEYPPESKIALLSGIDIFYNLKDAKKSLVKWFRSFGERRNMPLDVEFYDDVNLLYEDYKKNKFGAAMLYVDFFFDNYKQIKVSSDNFWSLSFSKSDKNRLCLISNKDLNIKGFKDMKGKKISISKNNISYNWLDKESLQLYKKSANQVLNKIIYNKKQSTILLNVYFKKSDFGIIDIFTWDTMHELNPKISKSVKILECLDFPAASYIGMFNKKMAIEEYMKVFFDFTQKTKEDEDSEEFFSVMGFDHLYRINESDLEKMNQFFKEYNSLKEKFK